MNLFAPINKVSKIGPVFESKLKKLGIETIHDLLYHFPHRYEDFSDLISIEKVELNKLCTVKGKILAINNIRTFKKRVTITEAILQDKSGAIKVVWFNQPYLVKNLKKNDEVFLSGKAIFKKNIIYLSNPVYEKISPITLHTGRLVPVYPETEGLSSRWLRIILKSVLVGLKNKIPEILPLEFNLLKIEKALWQIHFPESLKLAEKAKQRFSFEQLFLIQLAVLRQRIRITQEKSVSIPINLKFIKRLVSSLPYKLTNAQKKCSWQILKDLEKAYPMNRLLEGDVGSGKTIVATIAALSTVKAGYQVAFMAPTEILAKQHFQEVFKLLKNFNLDVGILTGKEDKFYSKKLKNDFIEISRKKLLEKTEKGEINVLIGTHALIQDKVKFNKLALVILDEQHRFGIKQRAKLCKQKNIIPHLLSMTATPIPRTLALTIYGDLDLSLLDELPKGRKKIITEIVKPEERKKTYAFIKKELKKGRQVFVVCPRIEEKENDNSNWSETKAVKKEFEILSKEIFPEFKVGMIHGKLASKEKERIMKDFKNKKIDIIVSTSVVEVGIDVPNASVMMIEGAERFGLAQLHQFRGRVGRSKFQSYCFVLTGSHSTKSYQRLKALKQAETGFVLAEKDLELRGPGEFSGTRQWGIPDLTMQSLTNLALIQETREKARQLLQKDFHLKNHPFLKQKLKNFQENIHLE
ncbi:MAG: ATP-dependent DNA helicase RecG [Candidatus Pacebacteria bacterium]|nr:ATP-dependent DNA helicase RecG [Candidatus Paceibacterota bacterium]